MEVQPSNLKAAFWMTGSLTAIILMAISGREASRELDVFQIMEMRSVIGLAMLYPLIRSSGGLRAMKTAVSGNTSDETQRIMPGSLPGCRPCR